MKSGNSMELKWQMWDLKKYSIMSEFLKNLKQAVDDGEFNSDAANKINEIGNAAEKIKFTDNEEVEAKAKERIDKIEPEVVSEEEIEKIKSDYEMKMAEIEKQDIVNRQLATLIQIEDMVNLSILDMFGFVDELDVVFEKELKEDSAYSDLANKVNKIKTKFEEFRLKKDKEEEK